LLIFVLGGCFDFEFDLFSDMDFMPGISVHSLYAKDEPIFDEDLLGIWIGEEGFFKFEEGEDANSYNLSIKDDEEECTLTAHLVKIDEQFFLDLSHSRLESDTCIVNHMLSVPAHLFAKINKNKSTLEMQIMSPATLLEDDPNLLKHEMVNRNILLTASSRQLQQFVIEHVDDANILTEWLILERLKPEDIYEPNSLEWNEINLRLIEKK
jgi:hypothetical protein